MSTCLLISTACFGAAFLTDFGVLVAAVSACAADTACTVAFACLGAFATEHSDGKKCSAEEGFDTIVH